MRFNVNDGDLGFVGIDMTRERDALEPGLLARGENTRLRTRRARQRNGTAMPADFNPVNAFNNYLVGSGVYRDPDGQEVLIVAPANSAYTWHVAWGRDPVQIAYAVGGATDPTGDNGPGGGPNGVQFCQAFDQLLLLRRPVVSSVLAPTGENLVWGGVPSGKWQVAQASTAGLGKGFALIPGVFNAEPFMDRVLYYRGNAPRSGVRDTWYVSDIEDYTVYDTIYQTIRTNSAEADFITRIFGYFHGSVIVFKHQSIHQVDFLPTYPFQVSQRVLSPTLGSWGTKIPVEVGGDVFFLNAPNGFFRLSEVIQSQIVTLPVAISEPIQPVIDSLNWAVTLVAGCSAVLDNYVLFGVAIGIGARACNAVLAYNTQTRQWESVPDTWQDPDFAFNALHVVDYYGAKRVFAVDYTNSAIYLLNEGVNDELKSGIWSVKFKVETRGYTGGNPLTWKRFFKTKIGISTFNPSITLTGIVDGFNEEKVLTPIPIQKDRTLFYPHGHKTFDPTTDDPNEAKREDYSISELDNLAIEDFEELPVGQISTLPGTLPPAVGNRQETLERYVVRQSGRWWSLRVENNQGSCDLLSVSSEGNATMDTVRTAA